MNFKDQQTALISFLSTNYKNYLPAYISEPGITTEFLDFDKFKGDFTLFIDFSQIDFQQSNYKDDCGDIEHLSLTVYLARRNNTSTILQSDILDAAYAFYEMIKNDSSLGIAQSTTINSIDFFRYVEATKYICVAEISLSLTIEI
ncbi:MAG: hypothetical protein LBK69_04365 [Syntrophomonadaceae bacterium]|jgi:hypothetical protein|nr:hypothetical protein [Syntrophomonadaceae bacterium]